MTTKELKRKRRREVTEDAVLVISRIDYPSGDFRIGLLKRAEQRARLEPRLGYVILASPIRHYAVVARIKAAEEEAKEDHFTAYDQWKELREEIKRRNRRVPKGGHKEELPTREEYGLATLKEAKAEARQRVLDEIVTELAELIPEFYDARGKQAKIYIQTTPAPSFDGKFAPYIVDELSKLRSDIIEWGTTDARYDLKGMYKTDNPDDYEEHQIAVLLPTKALWFSQYTGSSVKKIILENEKQSSQLPPSLYIVADVGAYVDRPLGGNRRTPVLSTPVAHKISSVKGSENLVGSMIVRFRKVDGELKIFPEVFDDKDAIHGERSYVEIPEGANEYQEAILLELKRHPRTIGQLEDMLARRWRDMGRRPLKRTRIEQEIEAYNDAGFKPAIVFDDPHYDFDPEYMMRELSYPLPKKSAIKTVKTLGYSCKHAGATATQYDWYNEVLPQLILEHGVDVLLDAGDQVEGHKHNLVLKKETIGGMNDTDMEIVAGAMPANVMLQVFEARLAEELSSIPKVERRKLSQQRIQGIVDRCLMEYKHRPGNHCEWCLDHGHTPNAVTLFVLQSYLYWGCRKALSKAGLSLDNLMQIVGQHTEYGGFYELPTGLTNSNHHPGQGRMQNWTGRVEQTMWSSDAQVVDVGNFHDAVVTLMWDAERGLRLGRQHGTIKSGTKFESNQNKRVWTGVWISTINSVKGRITSVENFFVGPKRGEMRSYSNKGGIPGVVMRALRDTVPEYDALWDVLDDAWKAEEERYQRADA